MNALREVVIGYGLRPINIDWAATPRYGPEGPWFSIPPHRELRTFLWAAPRGIHGAHDTIGFGASFLDLEEAIAACKSLQQHAVVAFTRFDRAEATRPAPNAEWVLLGYDATDHDGHSGLLDLGFTRQELIDLNQPEQYAFTKFGLFADWASADEFCAERSAQVLEHGPFVPVGRYLVNAADEARLFGGTKR